MGNYFKNSRVTESLDFEDNLEPVGPTATLDKTELNKGYRIYEAIYELNDEAAEFLLNIGSFNNTRIVGAVRRDYERFGYPKLKVKIYGSRDFQIPELVYYMGFGDNNDEWWIASDIWGKSIGGTQRDLKMNEDIAEQIDDIFGFNYLEKWKNNTINDFTNPLEEDLDLEDQGELNINFNNLNTWFDKNYIQALSRFNLNDEVAEFKRLRSEEDKIKYIINKYGDYKMWQLTLSTTNDWFDGEENGFPEGLENYNGRFTFYEAYKLIENIENNFNAAVEKGYINADKVGRIDEVDLYLVLPDAKVEPNSTEANYVEILNIYY